RRTLGLEPVEDGRRSVLPEAPPQGGDVAGVAHRDRERVRWLRELVADLEGGGLLPLDPVRVDRVDELDGVRLRQLANDLERPVEVPAQRDHARSVNQRLRELADRDLA